MGYVGLEFQIGRGAMTYNSLKPKRTFSDQGNCCEILHQESIRLSDKSPLPTKQITCFSTFLIAVDYAKEISSSKLSGDCRFYVRNKTGMTQRMCILFKNVYQLVARGYGHSEVLILENYIYISYIHQNSFGRAFYMATAGGGCGRLNYLTHV